MIGRKSPFIRITKKFSFEMAHALWGYTGPCKNIHGHTYKLSVTLIGKINDTESNPYNGMVMDFGDLKRIVHQNIVSKYDHALVLNRQAPYSKTTCISSEFEKVILAPFQPTCENVLLEFVSVLNPHFSDGIKLATVKLEETPSSYAIWNCDDNI